MRRVKPARRVWLLAASFVVAAVLGPAVGVAQPAPQTSLSISGQADWISPNQINVYVTVQGTGGPGFVNVEVVQALPPIFGRIGFGGTQIICDGQRHTYAVAVVGGGPAGFQLGEAEASANAGCPSSGSDFATQSIRIRKP